MNIDLLWSEWIIQFPIEHFVQSSRTKSTYKHAHLPTYLPTWRILIYFVSHNNSNSSSNEKKTFIFLLFFSFENWNMKPRKFEFVKNKPTLLVAISSLLFGIFNIVLGNLEIEWAFLMGHPRPLFLFKIPENK